MKPTEIQHLKTEINFKTISEDLEDFYNSIGNLLISRELITTFDIVTPKDSSYIGLKPHELMVIFKVGSYDQRHAVIRPAFGDYGNEVCLVIGEEPDCLCSEELTWIAKRLEQIEQILFGEL